MARLTPAAADAWSSARSERDAPEASGLTEEEIAGLREKLEKATKGPWRSSAERDEDTHEVLGGADLVGENFMPDDAALIIAMHAALPALLDMAARRTAAEAELAEKGGESLPHDVIKLVIAGREVAYCDPPAAVDLKMLDGALEAFASRVPWDDGPRPSGPPPNDRAREDRRRGGGVGAGAVPSDRRNDRRRLIDKEDVDPDDIYAAMLAAAPSSPPAEEGDR